MTGLKSEDPDSPPEITVQFDLDVNGILKVTARDRVSNKQESISVEASHTRMSEAEILAARDWANKEAADAELAELPQDAAALLRRAETLLDDEMDDDDRQALSALLKNIRDAQTNSESEDLGKMLDTLEDMLFDLDLE